MGVLFTALAICCLVLLTLLLWFVPHLLQQQAQRNATELAQMRDMILDLLNDNEEILQRIAKLETQSQENVNRKS